MLSLCLITMIGTIRKHSKWLWWIIAGATILSFIWWGASVPNRNGGGGVAEGDYGTIYDKKVTQDEYTAVKHDYFIFYWLHNGFEWPDRNPNVSNRDIDTQVYVRLLLLRKAQQLGIHADETSAAAMAGDLLSSPDLLRAFRMRGGSVPVEAFVKNVLQPEGFTADDLERFARDDLVLQQLQQLEGLPGALFTPQEAEATWRRDHRERDTQIVFFSATNYLPQITVTPAQVGQFYTNYMADYRLPDRVQVSYVEFNLSNYLAVAVQKIGRTNLDFQVGSIFSQEGMDAAPDAKTPEEAKAEIRQYLIRKAAVADAEAAANDFANTVFAMTPQSPADLITAAKDKGYTVETPAPFSAQYGPSEFIAPDTFIKAAFSLTPDEPFAGPVEGTYAYYVMALDHQLPTEIPPLERIRGQVTRDYQMQLATALARQTGTNFLSTLDLRLMVGRTFASVCVANGLSPETLPPFSLSTDTLPDLENRAGLPLVKQAAFGTPVGHPSNFEETDDGGFVLYVQKELPVDEAALKTNLTQYLAQVRQERMFEVFQDWVNTEAGRELKNTPVYAENSQAAPAK